jgi:TolB protein
MNYYILSMALTVWSFVHGNDPIVVTRAQAQSVGICIVYIDNNNAFLAAVTNVLATDLQASGQFTTIVKSEPQPPHYRTYITDLMKDGLYFCIMLSNTHKHKVEYRIYDTTTGELIPEGSGRYRAPKHHSSRESAHRIANKIWSVLTQQEGMFTSRIAYAKEAPYKNGITIQHICVADHDGHAERVIVNAPTISIIPRWGGTAQVPHLYYSEHTNTTVRLRGVTASGKRVIISRYDGTTMHCEQSPDKSAYAFCSSRGGRKCQIYYVCKGKMQMITANTGVNVCPVFNHDGTALYYCSDAATGNPQIVCYTLATKKEAPITISGYCVAPAYNAKRRLVAYAKMINGVMQLMVYDEKQKTHTQLTTGAGSHEDPTWSSCGNFIAYVHDHKGESRIVIRSYITGYERYITPRGVACSYPCWSPALEIDTLFIQ